MVGIQQQTTSFKLIRVLNPRPNERRTKQKGEPEQQTEQKTQPC